MDLPDLNRIVETHVPVEDVGRYLAQLRRDVLPSIRELQRSGKLRWFFFLLHPAKLLAGFATTDKSLVIHIRLEPAADVDVEDFIRALPAHFRAPVARPLGPIDGVQEEFLAGGDWALAWRLAGESSEWVLCLLEAHKGEPTPQQIVQFIHYITNPPALGLQCIERGTGLAF